MEENNLVSIVIPVYNASKYIKETIESIERQTYKNYEAIFIDDKSTDNSIQIIESYIKQNNKLKIIKLKKHKGVSKARNIGIRIAKGRYLTFLDADDIWFDKKLEKQIDFIQSNEYEFVYCAFKFMNNEGTRVSKKINIKEKTDYEYALLNTRILTITTMIDLDKIPKKYCYMPDTMNEEIITWWNILKKGYIAYGQNEVLAYYRKTKNSRSSKKHITALYRWKSYRKIENLSIIKSMYCFMHYAMNAILKRTTIMRKIDKYKEIEVGLSAQELTTNKEVEDLLKKQKITSKYIIINQTLNDNVSITNENVITKKEKGLSKSRNEVIKNATSEIVLIADDDVVYENDYEETILKYWNKYQDSDIICFYVKSRNKKRKIKRMISQKINWINSMRIASVEITFNKNSIINNGLKFNENFGSGTKLNRGEENIFLYDALRKKLKIRFINKKIGEVEQSESTWYTKHDKEFFEIQGQVFKEMSPKYYKLLILQFAIRKYYLYHKEISFLECLKSMNKK